MKPSLNEMEERKELSDEIEETIIALKDEIVVSNIKLSCRIATLPQVTDFRRKAWVSATAV